MRYPIPQTVVLVMVNEIVMNVMPVSLEQINSGMAPTTDFAVINREIRKLGYNSI